MENIMIWNEKNNELHIEGQLYNGIWFQSFGNIQHNILLLQNENIIVNMKECVFASPTPFLSLLLTLQKAKTKNGCNIIFYLPEDDSIKKKKFLNYCANEGFLSIINEISENGYYNIIKYKNYNLIGIDNFETIISARIINLSEETSAISEQVNNIINEINTSDLNVDKNQKLYMVIAVRNILQELIDNVYKHAYYNEAKYYALYIRIRYYTETTIRKGRENNSYGKLRVRVKPEEVYMHKAIEIYFQDIGKGIVKSYEEKNVTYKRRPLREIVKYTFFRERYEKRDNNTPINGLAFLRKILQEKNNYFTVYNQFEGTGAFGIKDKKINVNNVCLTDIVDGIVNGIEGQIYNFTLFDRNNIVNELTYLNSDLLEIYKRQYTTINNAIIDLRTEKVHTYEIKSYEIVLVFMPEYLTKNTIVENLRKVLTANPKIETLIIADVKDEELVLFEYALGGLYKENIIYNYNNLAIKKLSIVTKNLKYRCFDLTSIKARKIDESFKKFNYEYDYLYRMKIYESQEIAKVFEGHNIGQYILTKGQIEWSNKQVFKGFINFDMLMSNDRCFDLLLRNLERVMQIIGKKKLYAIDSTVERLVSCINCYYDLEYKEQFGIGSVFVSGMTLQSSDFQGNTIHFFCRGKGERKPALFFDPVYLYDSMNNTSKNVSYVRIGKTSRIKKKETNGVIRNSNSYLDEKEMYKILHQYAYSSVLCGHLYFEKRHDLLSINLNAIMYDENTRLREYVDNIIKYSLGHYFDKEIEVPDYFRVFEDTCMIVYPYNQFTSSVFKLSNLKNKYDKYIIGLTPTNITSSGEDLEYSECFTEYIYDVIKEYKENNADKKVKIIIFDTLSYSGRTRQEIYEYINSIELVEPYFVNIIDARVNHYPKQNNVFNYMNVNVPLLGKSETCKICLVLNKLDAFRDNIIDASILACIEKIQDIWKVRDIRNYKEIIKLSNFDRIYALNVMQYNIKAKHSNKDLYFVNALPLYIFITNRIKLENDFSAIEFVLDNYFTVMGNDSMAYMLSLFVLEYGDTIYLSLLRKICNVLLDYLGENKHIEVRQLAIISILSLNEERVIKIISKYVDFENMSIQTNVEGQMVLMYFLNKGKIYEGNKKIAFLYNKMKSGNNRLDLYKQFHCQLKNTNGNVHNSPLMSLVEKRENIENRRLTLASLMLLEQSLNRTELSFDMLYEEGRIDNDNIVDADISIIKEKSLADINDIRKMIYEQKKLTEIQKKIKEVFDAGQKLHKRLFAPYKLQMNLENKDIKPIETLLGERIDYYNDYKEDGRFKIYYNQFFDDVIGISDNVAVIYYIWNNMLVREIDYILDNIGKFVDEKNTVLLDGEKCAGEVRIEITPKYCVIKAFNNTDEAVVNIEYKAKKRYQKEVLALLGIEFIYRENGNENSKFSNSAVVTEIRVPNIQN